MAKLDRKTGVPASHCGPVAISFSGVTRPAPAYPPELDQPLLIQRRDLDGPRFTVQQIQGRGLGPARRFPPAVISSMCCLTISPNVVSRPIRALTGVSLRSTESWVKRNQPSASSCREVRLADMGRPLRRARARNVQKERFVIIGCSRAISVQRLSLKRRKGVKRCVGTAGRQLG